MGFFSFLSVNFFFEIRLNNNFFKKSKNKSGLIYLKFKKKVFFKIEIILFGPNCFNIIFLT